MSQELDELRAQAAELNSGLASLSTAIARAIIAEQNKTKTLTAAEKAEAARLKRLKETQEANQKQFDAIGRVTGGLGTLASGMMQTGAKFSSLNSAIDLAANATKTFFSGLPVIGGMIGAAARAMGDAAKMMNGKVDQLVGSFEALGSQGATTAGGLKEMFETVNNSRMSFEAFGRVVSSNGEALARFSGMTGVGAKKLAKTVGELANTPLGDKLRALGENADTFGLRAVAFMERENRLGRVRNMTQAQLTEGTERYARELDVLARLTGKSKDALQAQQNAMLSIPRFRAVVEEMERAQPGSSKKVQDWVSMLDTTSKPVADAMRDLLSGTSANSEAATALNAMSGGRMQQLADEIRMGRDVDANMKLMKEEAARVTRIYEQNVKVGGNANKAMDDMYVGLLDINKNKAMETGFKGATNATNTVAEAQDDMTRSVIGARIEIERFGQKMNNIVMAVLPDYTKMVESTLKGVITLLEKAGIDVRSSEEKAVATGQARNEAAHAASKGVMSIAPSRATDVDPDTGAPLGGAGMITSRSIPKKIRDAAPKASGSGQLSIGPNADMSGVNSTLLERMNQFAQSYGNPLRVNSAYRSDAKQAELWFRANELKEQGIYHPARPIGDHTVNYGGKTGIVRGQGGRGSTHTQGLALDISGPGFTRGTTTADAMLQQFGLHRPHRDTDPVHVEPKMARGGILTGPTSGYSAELHGTEAVVPLPDGRSIPLQSNPESSAMMAAQLDRLDTLISIMRNQVSISSKMLSYSS